MLGLLLSWALLVSGAALSGVAYGAEVLDEASFRQVQPLFEARCVACHSCFNAPCQLNLQSYEGYERGASKNSVYNGSRLKSIEPTRMWIDAHSTSQWKQKGFYGLSTASSDLFMTLIRQRMQTPQLKVEKSVAESLYCPQNLEEFKKIGSMGAQLGMPYGFPPLTTKEAQLIESWLKAGSPAPAKATLLRNSKEHSAIGKQVREWERFLNQSDKEHRLVGRYIYEHIFLGHLYFPAKKDAFFRLVRSKTRCDEGIQEIGTRRPNDNPGVETFYYCLRQLQETIVAKTHIPFELSADKLSRYKKMFWAEKWRVRSLPSYASGVAENPFIAFKDIPVKARYTFLLDEAQFFVNTFIKGPVCNGSMAVNSIQEQFFVFFLNPQSDATVISKEYELKSRDLLTLPGVWGSDVDITATPSFVSQLVEHREAYRKFRADGKAKFRPKGYSLEDIWNGEGTNPNAVLTVFRHDDNASVLKGAIGDLPKTVFMLDYPLFERLVYNLVVNFDVFGNVGHQLLTRQYMDFIRMEAEELFLSFLPSEDRVRYRQEWYKGLLAEAKMKYVFPTYGLSVPTAVPFLNPRHSKQQMVQKILFELMTEKVRGPLDPINWKSLTIPPAFVSDLTIDSVQRQLSTIASVKAEKETPFSRYFPDVALLRVLRGGSKERVFTIIHNKEHENIAWILGESLRLSPHEDSLTLKEGVWGSYPNIIFEVPEVELKTFTDAVREVKSAADYKKLKAQYAVTRESLRFWQVYDILISHYRDMSPVEFGYLDLTRYEL